MKKSLLLFAFVMGAFCFNSESALPDNYAEKLMVPLKKQEASEVAKQLNILQASVDALCIKTRGYTANVVTPDFYEFHNFFNATIKYLQEASYDVSERVRSLGEFANISLKDIQQKTMIEDAREVLTDPAAMIQQLLKDYMLLSTQARGIFRMAASIGDAGTIALATKTTNQLEHFRWEIGVMSSKHFAPKR